MEDVLLAQSLGLGDGTEDGIERPDPKRTVIRNCQTVMARCVSFENDVAAFLIDPPVAVMFAEELDQLGTAQVTRQFHATAKSSSRTRCSRTVAGLG